MGFPGSASGKESAANAGDAGDMDSTPGSGRFPWRRAWQPPPVFLPGESQGQKSLAGFSPWGCRVRQVRSDRACMCIYSRVYMSITTSPFIPPLPSMVSLVVQTVKHLPATRETQVQSLGQEDPLEKEMATHSSTLAWKIPWMEEPGGLQSLPSLFPGNHKVFCFYFYTCNSVLLISSFLHFY